jgi:hypothetical protein
LLVIHFISLIYDIAGTQVHIPKYQVIYHADLKPRKKAGMSIFKKCVQSIGCPLFHTHNGISSTMRQTAEGKVEC